MGTKERVVIRIQCVYKDGWIKCTYLGRCWGMPCFSLDWNKERVDSTRCAICSIWFSQKGQMKVNRSEASQFTSNGFLKKRRFFYSEFSNGKNLEIVGIIKCSRNPVGRFRFFGGRQYPIKLVIKGHVIASASNGNIKKLNESFF